jgi:hypothetical protein
MASLDLIVDLDMVEMSNDGHIVMSPVFLSPASSFSAQVANSRSVSATAGSHSTGNAASIAQSAFVTQRIFVAPQSSSSRLDPHEDVADRSEADIARLTWALLALAAGVLGFLLVGLVSWGPRPWLGWVGVVAASVIFSVRLPLAAPCVTRDCLD